MLLNPTFASFMTSSTGKLGDSRLRTLHCYHVILSHDSILLKPTACSVISLIRCHHLFFLLKPFHHRFKFKYLKLDISQIKLASQHCPQTYFHMDAEITSLFVFKLQHFGSNKSQDSSNVYLLKARMKSYCRNWQK